MHYIWNSTTLVCLIKPPCFCAYSPQSNGWYNLCEFSSVVIFTVVFHNKMCIILPFGDVFLSFISFFVSCLVFCFSISRKLTYSHLLCLTFLFVVYTFLIFKLFYRCSITVVFIFSPPLCPTPAKPTSLPCFHPPLWSCPCVLYSSSWKPFSPLSLPPSPLATVRLFLTSMSLVIFCLLFSFVDYVPPKGELIWYLSLTTWLISLSIMLSSSIHAVAKGIS